MGKKHTAKLLNKEQVLFRKVDAYMKLEKMDKFFEARLDGYEAHMLNEIESAEAFYPFTAAQLPGVPDAAVLDLGCGTGLELDWYIRDNPTARITGIDLSEGMLKFFREKYPEKKITVMPRYHNAQAGGEEHG